jgi:5-methyltetrahydrofolate--homocysteine methyltransferase
MADLNKIAEALIVGNAPEVKKLTEGALAEGVEPQDIVQQALIIGMTEVGRRFKANEFYVPEVLIAARAMHAGLDVLKPLLAESEIEPAGTIVVGTVQGDLHDIGKNLVGMMMEGAGLAVVDMGTDVHPDKFIQAIKENKPQVLGMSALLTTTMPAMNKTIEAIQEAGLRDQVKVIIGGAPVTKRYAQEIGADGYAPDAASAVDLVKKLLG